MAKVTRKLQVTVPKAIADQYGIKPGDDIEWTPAGEGIRVTPTRRTPAVPDIASRLGLFDAATERQRSREAGRPPAHAATSRGWRREDLYDRGRAD